MSATKDDKAGERTQHTPGIFHVTDKYPFAGKGPKGLWILDECGDILAWINPKTPSPISQANANLFASAPILLTEVERLKNENVRLTLELCKAAELNIKLLHAPK